MRLGGLDLPRGAMDRFVRPLTASWRGFGSARVGRNLIGLTVFLGLATAFNSDRAPQGSAVVASASALAIGERSRAVRPTVDPIAGAFAALDLGTAEAPRLRSTLDDSFAMVAGASRGQETIFEGLRVIQEDDDLALAFAPETFGISGGVVPASLTTIGPDAVQFSALPRLKPSGGPRVQVASLAPDAGVEPILRRKALDLATVDGIPRRYPMGSAPYLDLIAREAKANGVPLWVALGVIWVESKYNPKLRGSHGVLGMMQVMPSTARYLGYTGTNEQLLEPETNVIWGMKELGKGYKLSNGDLCMTVAKYTGGFMTNRVRPAAQRYCNEVRRITGMGETAPGGLAARSVAATP
jgi:hypothetical protein